VEGRIDGLTSNELDSFLLRQIDLGERIIILQMDKINYISSAGLRIFISIQQKLKTVGGELILFGLSDSIKDVFKLSGFNRIIKIYDDLIDIPITKPTKEQLLLVDSQTTLSKYSLLSKNRDLCKVELIGSSDKVLSSDYGKDDLVIINANHLGSSIGFASNGDNWNQVKNYFGEAFSINNNLFFYPANGRSAVDFMLYSEEYDSFKYSFLNGARIIGSYSRLISFDPLNPTIEISELLKDVSDNFNLPNFSFNILSESKGIRAMNLIKIPIQENKPSNHSLITDDDNFGDWFDFPVEVSNFNYIIAGTGFYQTNPQQDGALSKIIPSNSNFHLHCGIFERSLLSYRIYDFEKEMDKVFKEFRPVKVSHILKNSFVGKGILAIYELED